MTKNIIIVVLLVASIFFVVFANIKAEEAEKYNIQAQLNLKLVIENEAKAKAEEQKAVEAAATARIMERKADELQVQLDECNK